jgi:hypothetical protein
VQVSDFRDRGDRASGGRKRAVPLADRGVAGRAIVVYLDDESASTRRSRTSSERATPLRADPLFSRCGALDAQPETVYGNLLAR